MDDFIKIGIVGCFAGNTNLFDGQMVKTRTIRQALSFINSSKLYSVDTYRWKQKVFSLLFLIISAFNSCDIIIMLPAKNGLKVFSILFVLLNKMAHKKIFYVVIGGWLPSVIKENPILLKRLSYFDNIFVECKAMEDQLVAMGMTNIALLPNFKLIEPIANINLESHKNLKLCTFSRVTPEKGIARAAHIVESLNSSGVPCILDIYGKVATSFEQGLQLLLEIQGVNYKGTILPECAVEVLNNYDVLLFLTYYEGEGFPGTIIDAFHSGLPVIASKWKYNSEFISEGYNGHIVKDDDEAIAILIKLFHDRVLLKTLKQNSLASAQKYYYKSVMNDFYKYLGIWQ